MYIVKITQDKLGSLTENAEKMLRYGGKLMQCLDELQHESESEMGERNYTGDYRDMGMRGGNGGGGGYRMPMYDQEREMERERMMRDRYRDEEMGERRGCYGRR